MQEIFKFFTTKNGDFVRAQLILCDPPGNIHCCRDCVFDFDDENVLQETLSQKKVEAQESLNAMCFSMKIANLLRM